MMYDFIIKNATIYTGRKEAPIKGDIAISGTYIANISEHIDGALAHKLVDATGMVVTPGFIDPHASTGFGYFFPNAANHKLYQGITTEIFGNCGTSPAPIGEKLVPTMQRLSQEIGFPFEWSSLEGYFDQIQHRLQFNIATLVGHSTLRGGCLSDYQEVTAAEQQNMEKALEQAMEEGALGFSTGLIYSPGCFAETDEIVQLANVAAQRGGIYASHIRSEREEIEKAVNEALHIGHAANCRVLISHLKAAERPNWGKIPSILKKIEAYNEQHEHKAWVDVYPYTAVSTKLKAFIPKSFLSEGTQQIVPKLQVASAIEEIQQWIEHKNYDLDQMLVISNEKNTAFVNKTVDAIAKENNWSLALTIKNILLADVESWIVYHCINEEDMDAAILWKHAMICTDSWSYPINAPKTIGRPHPRSYGAFTEYLERYTIKTQRLSIEEAIYKVTHLPATVFQLEKRGLIEEGYFADLVVFDWNTIKANATYSNPTQLSEGVEHLWVNGQQVIRQGKLRSVQPGKVLRLNQSANVC